LTEKCIVQVPFSYGRSRRLFSKSAAFLFAQMEEGGDAMLFTSWFERLMQEKPGFNHCNGGGADAPESCSTCRFYRPDWKYQF